MGYIDTGEYCFDQLSDVLPDPFNQFSQWFSDAKTKTDDPRYSAVALSTSANNQPSTRIVLLKEHSPDGFVILSNYNSRKGMEIEKNNNVSLLFYWSNLEREIRIEGTIHKVSAEMSDKLFYERPRLSQIASVVSMQSQILESRAELEREFKQACEKYRDESVQIPRPDFFGGYNITPTSFEFWQGGEHRLNYRFLYTKNNENWQTNLLYP